MTADAPAAGRSADWLIRPFEASQLAPAWLGLGVAIAWSLGVLGVHRVADVFWGPQVAPLVPAIVVNGILLGVLFAGHAHLYLRAITDLHELAPILPGGEGELARLLHEVPNVPAPTRWGTTLFGLAGGLAIAVFDPNLRDLHAETAWSDPRYLVFLLQNALFGALGARVFAAEVHMTRAYARIGERVEVDLLDPSRLRVFARKGLRSVVVWVLVSSTVSLFWLIDSAGQANVPLAILILGLILVALVAPTLGVHRNVAATKAAELAVVGEAIRAERARTLAPRRPDAPEDARLGNLLAYQAFVRSVREWPFDLSIVSRSALLIVLGVGSWLGGAVVERLLDLLLD